MTPADNNAQGVHGPQRMSVTCCRNTMIPGFGSPLVLNFPSLVPEGEMDDLLVELDRQAGAYIDGARGQLQLSLDEEDDEDEVEV